jgi:hypothetical protein
MSRFSSRIGMDSGLQFSNNNTKLELYSVGLPGNPMLKKSQTLVHSSVKCFMSIPTHYSQTNFIGEDNRGDLGAPKKPHPLGEASGGTVWCRGPDSNRHEDKPRQILSLLRLPVPPPRHVLIKYNHQRGGA